FTDRTRHESAIKVMTDGMLLAELQGDPMLSEYEAIILDEAHERSLNIDFLLGCLKLLLVRRDDLKLVITSATIDTPLFAQAFGGAPVIEVSGRVYPVDVRYRPPATEDDEPGTAPYTESAAAAVEELLTESAEGDVLVFMPGERDIRETCELLEKRQRGRIDVVPLFGRLSGDEQQRVFAPGPRRRVVVATNVAETSLTVPRIRYVVDPGLARVKRYSPRQKLDRLHIEPISRASADQRKGRCGRVAAGVCYRLYEQGDYESRPPFTDPEIRRSALAGVILRMLSLGLGEVDRFPFIDAPDARAVSEGWQQLLELGAVDTARKLSSVGREMARWPVDVKLSRMLIAAR
ncbi:MAG: ATP-dependent helicase, partial [Verrucomicrobiae bacterium]|nr:ATP-dependent helicase [Verrucomicrobiae bacterium]